MRFPDNFLWGTATSAYQIEGGNNFTDWEMVKSKIKPAGRAVDHWNRYEQDIELMKQLNVNAYRCSIEWARIEPEQGTWDKEAIAHYRNEFELLRQNNITVFLTLLHYTIPQWAAAKGGWENQDLGTYFMRFAEYAYDELHDLIDFWIVENEPMTYVTNGYMKGAWPPLKRNLLLALKVIAHLTKVHQDIYEMLHKKNDSIKVGIAENVSFSGFLRGTLFDSIGAHIAYAWPDRFFLNRVRSFVDFIGVNYYSPAHFHVPFFRGKEHCSVSDLGWELYPRDLFFLLQDIAHKYKKPIFITENGIADAKDILRKDFIRDHLLVLYRAIESGIDVRGYFHWSLLDNFEWAHGFWPRFGLFEVDYHTMERKVRQSANYYAEICKNNGLQVT